MSNSVLLNCLFLFIFIMQMKFSVCLVLLVTVWQASAQAPGDEASTCVNQRGAYPPNRRMLMDSRNYEQLLTGSGAVWQALDVDGAGTGVGGRITNHKIVFMTYICSMPTHFGFYSSCSGEVHSEVSVLLSQGHVISERLEHKTTGSLHSTSATLMPERSL